MGNYRKMTETRVTSGVSKGEDKRTGADSGGRSGMEKARAKVEAKLVNANTASAPKSTELNARSPHAGSGPGTAKFDHTKNTNGA